MGKNYVNFSGRKFNFERKPDGTYNFTDDSLRADFANLSINVRGHPYNASVDGSDIIPILEKIKTDYPTSSVEIWFPRGEYTIKTNFVCLPSWKLVFFDGANLSVYAGITFNFNGCKIASDKFSNILQGTGEYIGVLNNNKIYPTWWGAKINYKPGREEIISLTLTNQCTTNGNLMLNIKGITVNVPVTSDDTSNLVAYKIYLECIKHATLYKFWNVELSSSTISSNPTIKFSSNDKGFRIGSINFNPASTGVTGIFAFVQTGKDGYANFITDNGTVTINKNQVVKNYPISSGGGIVSHYYRANSNLGSTNLAIENFSDTERWEDITDICISNDDTVAINNTFKFAKQQGFANVIIPSTGYSSKVSDQLNINTSNLKLEIDADIYSTKTTKTNVFKISNSDPSIPISNIEIKGKNINVDGNKNNVSGYTYDLMDTAYNCLLAWNCRDLKISGIKFKNGLVAGATILASQNTSVENCEFWNSGHDNGLDIGGYYNSSNDYGVVYNLPYDENNPLTWNNTVVKNCKSYFCVDMGMTAIRCVNVTFEKCEAYNCGNYYANSGQYNKGGGYSAEAVGNSYLRMRIKYDGCKAINCLGRGWYADGNDIKWINGCLADKIHDAGSIDASTRRDYGGNGIYITGSRYDIEINDMDIKNVDSHFISYLSGGQNVELNNFTCANFRFDNSGYEGVSLYGIGTSYSIQDGYIKNTGITETSYGIMMFNGSAVYNGTKGWIKYSNVKIDKTTSKAIESVGVGNVYLSNMDVLNNNMATGGNIAINFQSMDGSTMSGSTFCVDDIAVLYGQSVGETVAIRCDHYDRVHIGAIRTDLYTRHQILANTIKYYSIPEIVGSVTYDPGTIANGSRAITTITITGTAFGDKVNVSFDKDYLGVNLRGYVSSANTVTCIFYNDTGSPVTIPSGTLYVNVGLRNRV